MNYETGQRLRWTPLSPHKSAELVTVEELRRGGRAKLSNGWVVDEDGFAEGSGRIPGGTVSEARDEE